MASPYQEKYNVKGTMEVKSCENLKDLNEEVRLVDTEEVKKETSKPNLINQSIPKIVFSEDI